MHVVVETWPAGLSLKAVFVWDVSRAYIVVPFARAFSDLGATVQRSRRGDQLTRLAQMAPPVRRKVSELAQALLSVSAKRYEMMASTRLAWPPGKS
jgi:hypothetical protein